MGFDGGLFHNLYLLLESLFCTSSGIWAGVSGGLTTVMLTGFDAAIFGKMSMVFLFVASRSVLRMVELIAFRLKD